jgi:hypothetical protein
LAYSFFSLPGGRGGEKFLLLFEEKVAAGGVSTALNAHTVLPPDDGRGGEKTMNEHRRMAEEVAKKQ